MAEALGAPQLPDDGPLCIQCRYKAVHSIAQPAMSLDHRGMEAKQLKERSCGAQSFESVDAFENIS